MKKTYESTLPEGYVAVKVIDAKKQKTTIALNLGAIAVFLCSFFLGLWLLFPGGFDFSTLFSTKAIFPEIIFLCSMLLYVVLHELIHGLVYKVFTKQKLTFGISWRFAYCGVPNIYVYRKISILALMGPFTVFTVLMVPFFFVFRYPLTLFLLLTLFSIHLSGCVGDLYDFVLLLFFFRRKDLLVLDDGAKQTFYVPKKKTSSLLPPTEHCFFRSFHHSDEKSIWTYFAQSSSPRAQEIVSSKENRAYQLKKQIASASYIAFEEIETKELMGQFHYRKDRYGNYDCQVFVRDDFVYFEEVFDAFVTYLFARGAHRIAFIIDDSEKTLEAMFLRKGFVKEGALRDNYYCKKDVQGKPIWHSSLIYARREDEHEDIVGQ